MWIEGAGIQYHLEANNTNIKEYYVYTLTCKIHFVNFCISSKNLDFLQLFHAFFNFYFVGSGSSGSYSLSLNFLYFLFTGRCWKFLHFFQKSGFLRAIFFYIVGAGRSGSYGPALGGWWCSVEPTAERSPTSTSGRPRSCKCRSPVTGAVAGAGGGLYLLPEHSCVIQWQP